MKLNELFNAAKVQNNQQPTDGASAIFEATKSYSQHALNDMVEDHLPENTRVWKIQWVMSEDGNDNYRPQFIFAKTKNEAAQKFSKRMKHPTLGLVAIESIKEISFSSLNESNVIQFPGKKEPEYIPPYTNFSDEDATEWANGMINKIKKGLQHGEAEEYGAENWIDDMFAGDFPYDGTGRAQRMIIKIMLSHPDMNQIDAILKRKYNYNLPKILFADFNSLSEGNVIQPFPDKMLWSKMAYDKIKVPKSTDREKYDMATELQRIDKESDSRPVDLTIDADPTKEEMWNVFRKTFEDDDLKYWGQIAMYWFALDFHSGQNSNLYSVLSTSVYNPGPLVMGIEAEDDLTQEMYFTLYDYFSNPIAESEHRWAQRHGKRGERTEEQAEEIWLFLLDNIEEIKELIDNDVDFKQIADDYEVREEEIDNLYHSDEMYGLYNDGEDPEENTPAPLIGEKKKKKKATVGNNFGIKPAEKSTKYDPPKTKNKGVSARAGFIG